MPGVISTNPKAQFLTTLGVPMVGGTLTTYIAGTTTPVTTWQDQELLTANTNPIVLDVRGECVLWLDSAIQYKFVLKNSLGITQWTQDNISGAVTVFTGIFAKITDLIAYVKLIDLAALAGTTLVGTIASGAGAVARTQKSKNDDVVAVFDYLTEAEKADVTARTLTLDVSTNLQKAITASAGRRLLWPKGALLINKALNVSGRGSTSTIWIGEGFDTDMSSGTVVIARTAADGTLSPGWIADFTGSQNITIDEMNFWGTGANKATKGLLFARTLAFQYTQQIQLRKVCVKVESNPAATAVGSIAIANNQAEQFKTDHCAFYADCSTVLMLNNNLTLASPYQTIYSAIPSTTAMQFAATTFYGYTQSAIVAWGIASVNWDNSCVFARSGSSTAQYAIDLRSGGTAYNFPHALHICGQVEGYPGGLALGSANMEAHDVKTELFMVNLGNAAVVTAANVTMFNCEFDNPHPQNISGNFNLSCGTGNIMKGGKVVTYPGDFGITGGPLLLGTEVVLDASGQGLLPIAPGASMSGLGAPNGAQTNVTNNGYVYLNGILQASGVVSAGATIGTIDVSHRPNRTVYGVVFVSGVGSTYCSVTSGGLISLGVGLVASSQVSFDTFSFKRIN